MSLSSAMLQSAETGGTNNWLTPPNVFDPLHAEFNFALDAAADYGMERVPNHLSPDVDALTLDWAECSGGGSVFVNPPYGRGLERWIEKAFITGIRVPTVLLIFSNTDARYWHKYVMQADEVRFIEGRVNFIAGEDIYKKANGQSVLSLRKGETGPATKASALVIFRPGCFGQPCFCSWKLEKPRR